MNNLQPIHILMACDKNYAPYYGVLFTSMFINNPDSGFHIHWITDDTIPQKTKDIFESLVGEYHSQLSIYKIDKCKLSDYPQHGHINYAAYYHLTIAKILPESIHRVIYMDGDMIVKGDIRPLWEMDLGSNACAMVLGPMWNEEDVYERLGYDSKYGYYNNGVVLYDLDYLRKIDFSKQAIDYVNSHADILNMMDQDTENALLYDRILRLPVKYNYQIKLFWHSHWEEYEERFREELIETAKQGQVIIHYSDRHKPWQLIYDGLPYGKLWNKYYMMSPWRGIKFIGAPLNKYVKHIIKRMFKPELITSRFIPDVYKYLDK